MAFSKILSIPCPPPPTPSPLHQDLRPCSSAEVTADLVAKSLLANSFASLRGLKEGAEKEVRRAGAAGSRGRRLQSSVCFTAEVLLESQKAAI
jgi:hypothetical protein